MDYIEAGYIMVCVTGMIFSGLCFAGMLVTLHDIDKMEKKTKKLLKQIKRLRKEDELYGDYEYANVSQDGADAPESWNHDPEGADGSDN